MTTTDEQKRELLRRLAQAQKYGQTAFVLLYEAQLRALDART